MGNSAAQSTEFYLSHFLSLFSSFCFLWVSSCFPAHSHLHGHVSSPVSCIDYLQLPLTPITASCLHFHSFIFFLQSFFAALSAIITSVSCPVSCISPVMSTSAFCSVSSFVPSMFLWLYYVFSPSRVFFSTLCLMSAGFVWSVFQYLVSEFLLYVSYSCLLCVCVVLITSGLLLLYLVSEVRVSPYLVNSPLCSLVPFLFTLKFSFLLNIYTMFFTALGVIFSFVIFCSLPLVVMLFCTAVCLSAPWVPLTQ